MWFGALPLDGPDETLLGARLAHSERAGEALFRKGAEIDAALLAALRQAGLADITVFRIEADDIGEDDAAARIAALSNEQRRVLEHGATMGSVLASLVVSSSANRNSFHTSTKLNSSAPSSDCVATGSAIRANTA